MRASRATSWIARWRNATRGWYTPRSHRYSIPCACSLALRPSCGTWDCSAKRSARKHGSPAGQAAEVRLRAPHVTHDLRAQCCRVCKLSLRAYAAEKLHANPLRRTLQLAEQIGFDAQIAAVEGRPMADVRDRIPAGGGFKVEG